MILLMILSVIVLTMLMIVPKNNLQTLPHSMDNLKVVVTFHYMTFDSWKYVSIRNKA